jgi:hypothetical protein
VKWRPAAAPARASSGGAVGREHRGWLGVGSRPLAALARGDAPRERSWGGADTLGRGVEVGAEASLRLAAFAGLFPGRPGSSPDTAVAGWGELRLGLQESAQQR